MRKFLIIIFFFLIFNCVKKNNEILKNEMEKNLEINSEESIKLQDFFLVLEKNSKLVYDLNSGIKEQLDKIYSNTQEICEFYEKCKIKANSNLQESNNVLNQEINNLKEENGLIFF